MAKALQPTIMFVVAVLGGCGDNAIGQSSPDPRCYSVGQKVVGVAGGQILLNACTGDTWLLVQNQIGDAKPGERQTLSYSWYKIDRHDHLPPNLVGPLVPPGSPVTSGN